MNKSIFTKLHKDCNSKARTGVLHLPHGDVKTPVFMPVGTNATVKAVTKDSLEEIGSEIILAKCELTEEKSTEYKQVLEKLCNKYPLYK